MPLKQKETVTFDPENVEHVLDFKRMMETGKLGTFRFSHTEAFTSAPTQISHDINQKYMQMCEILGPDDMAAIFRRMEEKLTNQEPTIAIPTMGNSNVSNNVRSMLHLGSRGAQKAKVH